MQAEKRKNEHDNYDQTDEVNYSVHDEYSRARVDDYARNFIRITVLPLRSSSRKSRSHWNCRVHYLECCTAHFRPWKTNSTARCDTLARPF
jgi:hypothetical protein